MVVFVYVVLVESFGVVFVFGLAWVNIGVGWRGVCVARIEWRVELDCVGVVVRCCAACRWVVRLGCVGCCR